MAIAPFLALNNRGSTTPQLKRYINATPGSIGPLFGIIDTTTGSLDNMRGYPSVVKFGGSRTFLATVGLDIYRSTDGGLSWTSVFTFTSGTHLTAGSTVSKSGLFVLNVAGVATVCIVTQLNGSTSFFAFTSTDGTTWTTLGPFTGPSSGLYDPMDSVVWQGKLVTVWTNGGTNTETSTIFDPSTEAMTLAASASASGGTVLQSSALCVYNNRLFKLSHENGGGSNTYFRELVAGVWVVQGSNLLGGVALGADAKSVLFVDGAFMYGLATNGSAWLAYRWNSSLTRLDISALVVPTALASGLGTSQRMSVIVDDRGVPGTAPTIWLYQSVSGALASALNEWKWNSANTTIAALSDGVTLPTGTINVASTTGFASSGTIGVTTTTGTSTVTYTGKTGTTFTGCTGGTGSMSTGGAVQAAYFIGTSPSSAGSGPNDSGGTARDNLPFVKHAQGTTYWTSGEDFTQLAGLAPTAGGLIASFRLYSDGTTISFGSNGASLPQGTINVVSATGFPTTGSLYVQTAAGAQTVAYTGVTNFATTVAAGSNGVNVSTFVGAQTLNVVSTTGFPASGTLSVYTAAGLRFVSYTGTGPTTFTGCTTVGAVLTGVLATDGIVSLATFTGCTGGSGAMSTGGNVTQAVTGSVRAWQGTADQAYPLTAATLTGTTTGLKLDSTTVNTVTWQAATDGFTSGDRAKFVMEKY